MKNRELSKNYRKTKNFINFLSSMSVVILGSLFFLIPTISEMEPNKILFIVMLLYFGINSLSLESSQKVSTASGRDEKFLLKICSLQ